MLNAKSVVEIRQQYKKWGIHTPLNKAALNELMSPMASKFGLTLEECIGVARGKYTPEQILTMGK